MRGHTDSVKHHHRDCTGAGGVDRGRRGASGCIGDRRKDCNVQECQGACRGGDQPGDSTPTAIHLSAASVGS